MRFVLATLGTRGDIEPCAAIGRELQLRGHDVQMAVPPNYIGFIESAGLAAVAHGPDQDRQNAEIELKYGTTPSPMLMAWEIFQGITKLWPELGTALTSLADGADLLLTDASQQGLAANVADYYDIPQAAVHIYPITDNSHSQITKDAEDALRRELGLPEETGPPTRQPLEIQAYDELFFPGMAAAWADHGFRRPFVGGLTLELPTDVDDDVSSWITAGTPPIYFGFGSSARVASPRDVIAMITAACAQLGERALICSGVSDLAGLPDSDQVKIVNAVNHATVFPACRAVVHHGGPGTTFAGIRAGIPTLALAVSVDQPMWAAAVNQLEVGIGRRFIETTLDSLIADLRSILTPRCVTRTREVAAQMATPAESAATAADLLEDAVRVGTLADRQMPRTANRPVPTTQAPR
ncbi:glycosyltransferase [Mycobacterium sp. 852002-51613_SCH5001154]|uniref:glycosyltransferase n=1 Tax=Mycobacterium sp. 852002-51613_SCH5001154 TaxID=1834104 RepID=UPI0009ECFAC1|nr:glycosyltransferase [Mycobacterium sp. 852002-51613_SCH5001154]